MYDDITTIHFNRDEQSERYQQAIKSLEAIPTIKRVVGHSLGGSVALQIEKNILIELILVAYMARLFYM